jgi:hypothetical protein
MRRILKALILAWIGKKIYARMQRNESERELAERNGRSRVRRSA